MSVKAKLFGSKYKLIPEVVRFCLESDLFKEMETFIEKHEQSLTSHKSDLVSPSALPEVKDHNSFVLAEYKPEYTLIHRQFVKDFESKLEEFIRSKKSTPEKFYKLCQSASEHGQDTEVQSFLEILNQVTDFQLFMDLARDQTKRQYVKRILNSYAKMLPPVNR